MENKPFQLTKKRKIILASIGGIVCTVLILYIFVLPAVLTSKFFISTTKNIVLKTTGANLEIVNPVIKTSLTPKIFISFDKLSITKEKEQLLDIDKFFTAFSFDPIFKKELKFKALGVNKISLDATKLAKIFPQQQNDKKKKQEKLPFKINIFDSVFFVNECNVKSDLINGAKLTLNGKNLLIESEKNPKYIRFIFDILIENGSEKTKIRFTDNNKFYIKDRTLIADDCPLYINKSKILIQSLSNEGSSAFILKSKGFQIKDGADLLALNIFLNNGSDIIRELKDIKGTSDLYIRLDNEGLKGGVRVNKSSFKLKSLADLPVFVNGGIIRIEPSLITLKKFGGHYGSNVKNKLTLDGTVSDYYNSVDTKIAINTVMTDDFTRNYLSKLIGCTTTMTGDKPAGTRIEIYSKYNNIDIIYMAKIDSENDILIEGMSFSPLHYDRAIKCDMHIKGNILNIESLKYYIAKEIDKNSKGKITPIITMEGNVDIMNNSKILDFGFEIPKPLPSEFLNIFAGPKTFKKGQISGGIKWLNRGKTPKLKGNLAFDKVIIPSQRLFIKEGKFQTDRNYLNFTSNGYFRRSKYDLKGQISNSIVFPIIVDNFNLTIDNIDLEKLLLAQANSQKTTKNEQSEEEFIKAVEENKVEDTDVAAPVFVPNLIEIKNGEFNLIKGKYKDIEFGNLKAKISLDRNGNLDISSNRFDFAKGHSSAKVICNLVENKFRVILGARKIDSDIVAGALLNLRREITGLASGIIDINTDETLQLNGIIKFDIDNGTIEKMGLVEYALNFVSFFRNPMAMISPSTIFDLVNIPEGNFDRIWGDITIKNNVVNRMMIKTTAPELATLTMGRFDLVTRDASLRIYTKFSNKNKGFTGFLRGISLNSLANVGSFGTKNDINYYSAELALIPKLKEDEENSQIFLTTVDGDVEKNNFLSALKKIK